ncbi:TonB-dependent receptor [Chitinophaga defluvii]|uniref:TonB-dependent receptor n=1 Tax=Chitinophaga defluvii TaxID=3163343 RepID=A0ABV2T3P2_9BACT
MQKNLFIQGRFAGRGMTALILRAMRITVFLTLACVVNLYATGYSQETKLTLNLKDVKLSEVLSVIQQETDYQFLYNDEDVKNAPSVSVSVKDATVPQILAICFKNYPLNYRIGNKTVVVLPKVALPVNMALQGIVAVPPFVVKGRVTDESGNPLSGVSVGLKGQSTGTVTDANGYYSLTLADGNGTLVFSFIGYTRLEKAVDGRSGIDVVLLKSVSVLNELVTVGYGVQKKENLTGAITQISGEQLADRPASNLEQVLQGAVPGLNIQATTSSGQPGVGNSVNIRGLGSLSNSAGGASFTLGQPFVLVDGVPMELNDVDPNNVKSISILKDAASTAIYGARAAYGVILITTKTGTEGGGMKVSYSYNYALAQPTTFPRQVDALSFALILDSAAVNTGIAQPYTQEAIDRIKQYMQDPVNTPGVVPNAAGTGWDFTGSGLGGNANTDWYDVLFKKNAIRQTHNISISGSGKNISYALSGGFFHEDGISRYASEQYTRKTLSGRIESTPLNWLKVGLITKFVGSEDSYPWDISADGRDFFMNRVARNAPTLPLYNPAGGFLNASGINSGLNEKEQRKTTQWVLSPTIRLEPVKNWVTTLQYNYTYTNYTQTDIANTFYQLQPDSTKLYGLNQTQTKYIATARTSTYTSPNITSTYYRQIGGHYIGGLVGYQQELQTIFGISGNATYLLTDNVPSLSTSVGVKTPADDKGHWATQSYFGRLNYNFNEKYLFEANVRRDGSSRFAPGSRWGTFPSVSVGYNIAKENFFPLKEHISMLKFRGSWGAIGNQNVANYLYIPLMTNSIGNYLLGGEKPFLVLPPNETTTSLTWEKVNTKDIGLDMYMFDNRLYIAADWYQSDINNLVGPGMATPQIYGGTVPRNNDGSLRTRGWEVQVNWKQSLGNGFSYFVNANLSDHRSVVTSYNNPLNLLSTFYKGQVIGEIWGYKTDGLYQSEEEVTKRGVDQSFIFSGNWTPGDVKYRDMNGDNVINDGKKTADDHGDLTVIGNSQARYKYGVYAGANYKGIDLSFMIQGVGKQAIWPGGGVQNAFWGPSQGEGGVVILQGQEDYWRSDNPNAYFPKPYFGGASTARTTMNKATTDRYLQNKAYLRLKSLQIGYSLPVSLISRIKASQLRFYFSGENLFTSTKYMFFDPELSSYGNYPLQKVFSFGCNVTF